VSVYSHSRISSFENCPLQYQYRYIDKIRSEVQGVEAFMGKLVHEVLEALYADLPRARAEGAGPFREMFQRLWDSNVNSSVRVVRENMTLADYRALGSQCVEEFYRRYHPFDTGEVLGCELEVEFSLDAAGQYRMRGFIDRVDRLASGVFEVHDYKTGVLPRAGALRRDRQLTLYEIALREMWEGVRQVRLVWHYLAYDREFVEQRSLEDLQRVRIDTIRSIQDIEASAQFPARVGPLCSWCEYRAICPAMAGRRALEQADAVMVSPRPAVNPRTGQYHLFETALDR
jgi:putative RecB family exonuclease